MTEEEKKQILDNLDAIYEFLDLFLEDMKIEEVDAWEKVLKKIDPNFENQEQHE